MLRAPLEHTSHSPLSLHDHVLVRLMSLAAVALLHVARKISKNGFSDKLVDSIVTILGRDFNQCCSVLCLPRAELNTSELVEFLQKSAVEHLTTYRQLMARDFGSVATIVTTDFEALYAYKRGDYQRCLQLSTQNVHTLFACPMWRYVRCLTVYSII